MFICLGFDEEVEKPYAPPGSLFKSRTFTLNVKIYLKAECIKDFFRQINRPMKDWVCGVSWQGQLI